ncbi:MAG: CPBP family intramembrane metalloprotease [Opitutaceae bacterium]|nr:CPBP family intramembrane metalloprotease [Opitutaceae bacterium]
MPLSAENLVATLEVALAATGLVLLWRLVLGPAARARATGPRLAAWEVSVPEFLVFILFIIGGSLFFGAAASLALRQLHLRGDAVTVVSGAATQFGMLAGVLFYRSRTAPVAGSTPARGNVVIAGAATFLMCLPVMLVTAAVWEKVLLAFGLPVERQDLIAMFANADSPWLLAVMVTLAVVIAPLTEEFVFRAGLFRYLRTRIPRWLALTAPALFFACLHVNWSTLQGLTSLAPLAVLAVLFSLAYERTGQIGTAIVAHALFNLNTIVLIFSGVGL